MPWTCRILHIERVLHGNLMIFQSQPVRDRHESSDEEDEDEFHYDMEDDAQRLVSLSFFLYWYHGL